MRRALLIVLAVVVAALAAGVAAAHFYLGEDALRMRAEAAVETATGRRLTIAGPVRLGWSLAPTIEANDVSLANPPGFAQPTMAHIDRIEAKLSLLPLLSRSVEVSGLTLVRPAVALERDAQGRPNWVFAKPAAPRAPSAPSEGGRKFTLDVGEATVTDATLALPGGVAVTAPRLTFDPRSQNIAGEVAFRGMAGHLTGTAAPLDLRFVGDGLTLAVAGSGVVAEVADLSALSTVAGARLPTLRNIRFETKPTLGADSITLDGLKLTSAQGDLAGDLTVSRGPRLAVRGALRSTRFDLDALVPTPVTAAASPSTPPAQAAPRPPDRVVPDTPIPYAALRGADADLQLDAAALTWRGTTYPNVAAHLLLQDGRLVLDPARIALGDKALSARIEVDAAAQTVAAKLDAPGLPAGPLSALLGGPSAAGALDVRADLRGQGATWRAVAAKLQGTAGLAMVDGEIDNAWLLDKLQGALRAANLPIAAGGESKVRCAALRADASEGRVRVEALTLDSSKVNLDGTGEINLADETLDLHLRPVFRLGAALSVPIHVEGTLRTPKAALDPGAITPGRVGISIGGPAPADTCGPALALARGGQPGPAAPEPVANRPLKPADLLRGLLR